MFVFGQGFCSIIKGREWSVILKSAEVGSVSEEGDRFDIYLFYWSFIYLYKSGSFLFSEILVVQLKCLPLRAIREVQKEKDLAALYV